MHNTPARSRAEIGRGRIEEIMSRSLTGTEKSEYLKSSHHCPYCGSDTIHANETYYSNDGAQQRVDCETCGARWWDIYKLVDVQEG